MVEVRIEGRRLDVFEGFDFSFNYGVADIRNPEKRSTEYSKTIKCPATKSNDALFGHIYDVNISNNYDANTSNISVNFNPNKKAEARVIADGVEVMAGVVQLRKVMQKGHAYTYEVVFIGKLLNIFSVLGDKQLNDKYGVDNDGNGIDDEFLPYIDLSAFDHLFNRTNQEYSWSAPIGEGYVYPMVDFGKSFEFSPDGYRDYRVDDFRPAIYAKQLFDKIFEFADFTYSSNFLNSNTFKRLCILLDQPTLSSEVANTRAFKSVKNINQFQSMHRIPSVNPDGFGNEAVFSGGGIMPKLCFEDDNVDGFDNNNQYAILSTPSTLAGQLNNYTFVCQQSERNDIFRASVDLRLIKNNSLASNWYNGTLEIVKQDTIGNIEIIGSTFWSWDLNSIAISSSATQTLYVAAETITNFNDQVYVRMMAEGYPTTAGFDPSWLLPTVKLAYVVEGGYFENEPILGEVFEGDTMKLSDQLPDTKMSDFLLSIFKMFNLYVTVDPLNENNLLIETRDTFYSQGEIKDWTYKLARDKDIALEPLGVLADNEYIYTYTEDGDYYNERYQNNRGHAYGRARLEVDNDFVQSSKEVEVVFSPSPLVNDDPSNRIIPAIWDADIEEGAKTTNINIRIIYYGGLLPSEPKWLHSQVDGTIVEQDFYPYAGHWDNPITPTLDINFGLTLELYYQSNSYTGTLQVTNANLYNLYHRNYINEITDKDSKVMTALFYLEPTDINTLDFRDQIVIDNAYWRLNKVMNYNPFKEGLTKVELIKIKEPVTFSKGSRNLNSSGFLGAERLPNPSTEIKTNGNKYPPFQGKVSGRDNSVGHSVTAFKVVGSNNRIGEGSRNIVILGDGNEVNGGLHNVQLINTNGVTITDSNVTFVSGKQQENRDVLDGSKDDVRALNGGTNIFTVNGGLNIVQTQFSDSAIYIIEGGFN